MAEFNSEDYGTSFELPDSMTVGKQLEFYSAASGISGEPQYIRYWRGLLQIKENWKSELLPEPDGLDLNEETDPEIASLILWASTTTVAHMNRLEKVPKN